MRPTGTERGLRISASIAGRVAMLLFWAVLAAAVFLEALRQYLSPRYVSPLRQRPLARMISVGGMLLCAVLATQARAETLVSDTSMVSGTATSVFAFATPGPGTVTLELSDVGWPQPMTSLQFLLGAPGSVIAPWTSAGSAPSYFAFASGGAFAVDVRATAGGPLDLGVYSLSVLFTPAAGPVPLPASGELLLGGGAVLVLLALAWTRRRQAGGSRLRWPREPVSAC